MVIGSFEEVRTLYEDLVRGGLRRTETSIIIPPLDESP